MARILVVDDELSNRGLIVRLLTEAGYETTAASSFEEGRRLLGAGTFDLLVTDLRLEGFNGLQLIISNNQPTPSIVMTGFVDPSLEAEARRLGADFLAKPFAPRALLDLVTAKLGGQKS